MKKYYHLKTMSSNAKHLYNIFLNAALTMSLSFVRFYISGFILYVREGFGHDLVFATINLKECFVKTYLKFVQKVWGILRGITAFHTI